MVVTIIVQPGTTNTIYNVPVDYTYDSAAYTSRGLSIVRAEHLQSEIEKRLYHEAAGHPALPRGEYQLSQHVGDRCVYKMCIRDREYGVSPAQYRKNLEESTEK